MIKPARKLTKRGFGKPPGPLKIPALVTCASLLACICVGLAAAPARARETGNDLETDGMSPWTEHAPGIDGLPPEAAPLPYKPGEVLVRFAGSSAAERITSLLDRLGVSGAAEEVFREGEELLTLLKLDAGVAVAEVVKLLEHLAGVIYAEPNYIARAGYIPADPDYQPEQWGLNNYGQVIEGQAGLPGADISAQEAWDIEKGLSNQVTVAVIDSGMDLGHPDLDGKIWDNTDEITANGVDDDLNGYVDDVSGYNWAGITQSRYYYYDYVDETYYTTARYFGSSSTNGKRAQSIRGTGEGLTHVGFALESEGTPADDITVSLRSDRDGATLASLTIYASEVGPAIGEIYKPLSPAVALTAGATYYLVLETAAGDLSNCYYIYDNWGTGDPDTDQFDPYRDGRESRRSGSGWVEYPDDDLYFRTNANAVPRDDNGHGTHVGGIVAAEEGNGQGGVGVSFGAGLMPLKVMDCTGSGYNSDITAAIYYAADNGARLINLSLGGTHYSQAMQDAVDYAHAAGAVVFASSGNSGDGTMQYPAGYGNVVGVGATTNTGEHAGFSTYNSSVDLSAPGRLVYSTMPTYPVGLNSHGYAQNYDFLSGTSMAAPMASGLAALVRSQKPSCDPGRVEWMMKEYAHDLGAPGRDDYFGYGRIDARRTLENMASTPYIDSVIPTSGQVGTEVAIGGTAFGPLRGSSHVSFGGEQVTVYVSWSDTDVTCHVPEGISGLVEVVVTTTGGTSNSRTFAVRPHAIDVDPDSGEAGTKASITGTAFGAMRGSSYVSFGGDPALVYESWSDSSITCYVPTGISDQVDVTVTTPGGTSNGLPFTVTTNPQATTWYLAEGSTAGGMETFILVQNPGDSEAEVRLTFVTENGPQAGPTAVLPPHTRFTWKANDFITSYNVSTTVTSTKPVVAERAMYGNSRTWAHGSVGCSP